MFNIQDVPGLEDDLIKVNKHIDASEMAAVIEICHTASLIHDDIITGYMHGADRLKPVCSFLNLSFVFYS